MLPLVAAFTLKAFLARANGEITHVADVHDVKADGIVFSCSKARMKIQYLFGPFIPMASDQKGTFDKIHRSGGRARSVLPRPRANIPQYGPSKRG